MTDLFNGIIVLIPTRNRSKIVQKSILSVLKQQQANVKLVVSDNSTEAEEINSLKSFCEELNNPSLTLISPPKPLSMTEHWNWAMSQLLEISTASHIIYLSDRMILRENSLSELTEIASKFQNDIISYGWDDINDLKSPVVLRLDEWSGKLFEISSSYMIEKAAGIKQIVPMPNMVNCCVPRGVIEKIYKTFNYYFNSVSPDINFCFSALSIVQRVLFLDKALLVNANFTESNGRTLAAGIMSPEAVDFLSYIKNYNLSFDSPVKSPHLATNSVMHEYQSIKKTSAGKNFPEFDYDRYLLFLFGNIITFENHELKREMIKSFYTNLGIKAAKYHLKTKIPVRTMLKKWFGKTESGNDENLKLFEKSAEAVEYARCHPVELTTSMNTTQARLDTNFADGKIKELTK